MGTVSRKFMSLHTISAQQRDGQQMYIVHKVYNIIIFGMALLCNVM